MFWGNLVSMKRKITSNTVILLYLLNILFHQIFVILPSTIRKTNIIFWWGKKSYTCTKMTCCDTINWKKGTLWLMRLLWSTVCQNYRSSNRAVFSHGFCKKKSFWSSLHFMFFENCVCLVQYTITKNHSTYSLQIICTICTFLFVNHTHTHTKKTHFRSGQ